LLKPSFSNNIIHTILFESDETISHWEQSLGEDIPYSINTFKFSPDGSKVANAITGNYVGYSDWLYIYDFDRCNSRILLRFDLEADDIAASKEIVATLEDFPDNSALSRGFGFLHLGADGKIYAPTLPGNQYYHIVNNPKLEDDIAFRQNGLMIPNDNNGSHPNFPNYRLGPLDGSPCDTLGIDNIPLANFNFFLADSLDDLTFGFTDHSAYEPTEWFWTIDDGSTYTGESFEHSFSTYGTYEVCLTVSNVNGGDANCKNVEISPITSIERLLPSLERFEVVPSLVAPDGAFSVELSTTSSNDFSMTIVDVNGQVVAEKVLDVIGGVSNISLTAPKVRGLYFVSISDTNGEVAVRKLMVQ